jgi:hypothetical protein
MAKAKRVRWIGKVSREDRHRFLENVSRPNNSPKTCWEWQLSRDEEGYGRVSINGQVVKAHRLAYTIVNGDPGEQVVRHTCDNPPCCRPDHLIAGTTQDNTDDKMKRGRHVHHLNKITWEMVCAIRERPAEVKDKVIAEEYGITRQNVNMIRRYITWKEEPRAVESPPVLNDVPLMAERIAEMRRQRQKEQPSDGKRHSPTESAPAGGRRARRIR